MNDDTFYGLDGWEQLEDSIEGAIERIVEENLELNECELDALGKIAWPIVLNVYRHMEKPSAASMLEDVLERLDELHADPAGDNTEPTPTMLAHMQAILDEYKVFMCEETGEKVTVTREQAVKMLGEEGGQP